MCATSKHCNHLRIPPSHIFKQDATLSNIHVDVFSAKCALLGGHNQSERVIESGAPACEEASYFDG